MTFISLFSSDRLVCAASATGLNIAGELARSLTATGLTVSKRLTKFENAWLVDLRMLQEQGLLQSSSSGLLVQTEDWSLGVELGADSLVAYSDPSHLMLEVDRESELGRADFRYVFRWKEGGSDVAVEKAGPYLRMLGSGRVLHLDARTLALVEGMESFNRLPEAEKRSTRNSWGAFSSIKADAEAVGALLDEYLVSNSVIIPGSIALTVREHGDGSISFEPRLPESDVGPAFTAKFMDGITVQDMSVVTTSDGARRRILFSEPQQEVLRRMLAVRRVGGERGTALKSSPVRAFDGVADEIDLSNISFEYGPRVIGIGPLSRTGNESRENSQTFSQLLQIEKSAEAPVDAELNPVRAPRASVSIEVVEDSGAVTAVRLESEAEVAEMLSAVTGALERGAETVQWKDKFIRVEPALSGVLSRHLAPDRNRDDVGAVGTTGHLYLLINEHESTLTEALLLPALDEEPGFTGEPIGTPQTLRVNLKPHQMDGLQWLADSRLSKSRRGGILADDMGLGKTLQLLSHVAQLIESGELSDSVSTGPNGPWRPALVIAPLLLVESGTWTEEMRTRFADEGRVFEPWVVLRDEGLRKVMREGAMRDPLGKPQLDPARLMAHKVIITTYETLVAYQHSLAQLVDGRPLWSLVIFDEAQEVKSPSIKQSYAAKALDSRFKIAATGTPVETRLRDLWNLLDTVEPTRLGSQREFVAAFERPAQNATTGEERRVVLDDLRRRLRYQQPGALLLRRDKSVLEGLPAKIEHRPSCVLTVQERALSLSLRRSMSGAGRKAPLVTLQAMHLASQHPALVDGDWQSKSVEALLASSGRLQVLVSLLGEIQQRREKVLIFVRSIPAQRLLAQVIGDVFAIRVDVVNGEAKISEATRRVNAGTARRQMLDGFRQAEGFSAIILSPFVAGVGITLTEANHVIHYGRWWNPAVESQATDRAYRIGQTKDVHVYYPISVDDSGEIAQTFDQALDALIASRRSLADDFLAPDNQDALARALFDSLGEQGA